MTSRSMLNLTLDEIIQNKRGQGKNQMSNFLKNRITGRRMNMKTMPMKTMPMKTMPMKTMPMKNFPRNTNISLSLSNRLSRGGGGGGFKMRDVGLRRTNIMQNRLGLTSENQRISVHNRLTLNRNTQEAPYRSRVLIQNRPLMTKRNLKTKNSDDSQPVRITNGAIVKGLRSDQLLLQKLNKHKNTNLQAKMEKLRALQMKRSQMSERDERRTLRPNGSSKVSLNFDRGLTVSIANEVAKRAKSNRTKRPYAPLASSSSEDSYPLPRTSRRFTEEAKETPTAPSLLRLGLERPPPPKPHRQTLDPQIQKEISALQGFSDPHSGGPGPGVKGFKMMPSRTKHSLNERFTLERSVVD